MSPFLNTEALSTTAALATDPRFKVVKRFLASGRVLLCSTLQAWIAPFFFRRSSTAKPLIHFTPFLTLELGALAVCWRLHRFLWPGMNKDVGSRASSCPDCKITKVARHVCLSVQRIVMPSQHFSHVHIDLVGPLPSVSGYTHMFTVVDRSTCWPVAYPVQDTSTTACINALVEWISCFGVPATVTSDQGSQFTSSSWSAFCRSVGIQHVMTTAYHPQTCVLASKAALGPPRPQERASGAVWRFFR